MGLAQHAMVTSPTGKGVIVMGGDTAPQKSSKDSVLPPMAITPLPVGDVTIARNSNANGKFGPEI